MRLGESKLKYAWTASRYVYQLPFPDKMKMAVAQQRLVKTNALLFPMRRARMSTPIPSVSPRPSHSPCPRERPQRLSKLLLRTSQHLQRPPLLLLVTAGLVHASFVRLSSLRTTTALRQSHPQSCVARRRGPTLVYHHHHSLRQARALAPAPLLQSSEPPRVSERSPESDSARRARHAAFAVRPRPRDRAGCCATSFPVPVWPSLPASTSRAAQYHRCRSRSVTPTPVAPKHIAFYLTILSTLLEVSRDHWERENAWQEGETLLAGWRWTD